MKLKRFLIVFCMIIISFFVISNISLADGVSSEDIEKIKTNMDSSQTVNTGDITGLKTVINIIIGLIQIAGTGVSVAMVSILGLKYIMASAEDKADLKKAAVPVVTGAIVLFAASNLVKIIASIGDGL